MTLLAELEMIACENIEATAATQVRVKLDKSTIDQYTEDMQNGADMPPIVVFREQNSDRNILADGFHRLYAAVNCEWEQIGCEVHEGDMHAALEYALGANSAHGLRRSNRDKRHAVEMALKDPQMSRLQQQEVADICRVDVRTVRRIQNDLLTGGDEEDRTKSGSNNGNNVAAATDEDIRDTGAEVSQEDVDTEEIRQACKLIKGLPYDGEGALNLPLSPDDIADLEYVSTWAANAVISYRNQGESADDGS